MFVRFVETFKPVLASVVPVAIEVGRPTVDVGLLPNEDEGRVPTEGSWVRLRSFI